MNNIECNNILYSTFSSDANSEYNYTESYYGLGIQYILYDIFFFIMQINL